MTAYTCASVATDDRVSEPPLEAAVGATDGAVVCACVHCDTVTEVWSCVLAICRGANHRGEDSETFGLHLDTVEVVVAAAYTTAHHRIISITRKQRTLNRHPWL